MSGYAIILLVPLDKSRQSRFDCSLRLEAEVATGAFDVGEAFGDIAGLQRQRLFLCCAAELPLKHGDEIEKPLRPVIAEIVYSMRNPRDGRRRPIMRGDRPG